jgi:hypothetical protein
VPSHGKKEGWSLAWKKGWGGDPLMMPQRLEETAARLEKTENSHDDSLVFVRLPIGDDEIHQLVGCGETGLPNESGDLGPDCSERGELVRARAPDLAIEESDHLASVGIEVFGNAQPFLLFAKVACPSGVDQFDGAKSSGAIGKVSHLREERPEFLVEVFECKVFRDVCRPATGTHFIENLIIIVVRAGESDHPRLGVLRKFLDLLQSNVFRIDSARVGLAQIDEVEHDARFILAKLNRLGLSFDDGYFARNHMREDLFESFAKLFDSQRLVIDYCDAKRVLISGVD